MPYRVEDAEAFERGWLSMADVYVEDKDFEAAKVRFCDPAGWWSKNWAQKASKSRRYG